MRAFGAPETQSAVTENNLDRNIVEKQTVTWYGLWNRNSLSRGAPSTTRPPLRFGVPMAKRFGLQGVFGDLSKIWLKAILQIITPENGTSRERVGTCDTLASQSSLGTFSMLL